MEDDLIVKGMVLKSAPAGDYDRRVTILTLEKGKITAFARGARRPSSPLLAAMSPFSFGSFTLRPGKSAYSILKAEIDTYFESLREDLESACYGMYFLEIADYYSRENNEDPELLKLLYVSLRALESKRFPKRLIRCTFEIRALDIEGEYPGLPEKNTYDPALSKALQFIVTSPIGKLYTFMVSDRVLDQLSSLTKTFRGRFMDRPMRSLTLLMTFENQTT